MFLGLFVTGIDFKDLLLTKGGLISDILGY
jgi:hypothetical protein